MKRTRVVCIMALFVLSASGNPLAQETAKTERFKPALLSPDSTTTRFAAGLCETVSYGALKVMIKYAPN